MTTQTLSFFAIFTASFIERKGGLIMAFLICAGIVYGIEIGVVIFMIYTVYKLARKLEK